MTLARALALFAGLLALDAFVAFVLLVAGGIVAPKGTGLTVVLGGVLGAAFLAFCAIAAIYFRMLFAPDPALAGRWLLASLFVLASIALYLCTVVVTLVLFNR